jgi:hypothetical protein
MRYAGRGFVADRLHLVVPLDSSSTRLSKLRVCDTIPHPTFLSSTPQSLTILMVASSDCLHPRSDPLKVYRPTPCPAKCPAMSVLPSMYIACANRVHASAATAHCAHGKPVQTPAPDPFLRTDHPPFPHSPPLAQLQRSQLTPPLTLRIFL